MDWPRVLKPSYWRKQPTKGMQEALAVFGAVTNEYANLDIWTDSRGLRLVTLPVGYKLYKGRFKPSQLLQSPHNAYADKVAWFGPKGVADQYNGDASRRFVTYELKVLKPLTLVLLLDTGNAKFIVKELLDRIKNGDEAAKTLLTGYCMATGFGVTYDEQLAFYKTVEKVYTPILVRPDLHDIRFEAGNGVYVSRLRSDFHRVSIRTSIDTDMANAICTTCGYDGYLMHNTPSFLCQKEFCQPEGHLYYLNEEIALCNQRGIEISIGGRIPDYLGLQAALFHDRNREIITKYFLPTRAARMVIEREKQASKALKGKPGLAPFASFRYDEKSSYVIASRKAWDTDLSLFLLSNAAKVRFEQLEKIFAQVRKACEVMAEADVVHGDMKLENILVSRNGQAVAISDFGTAKVVRGVQYKTFRINDNDVQALTKKYDFYSFCLHFWVMCAYLEQHPSAQDVFQTFRTTVLERYVKPDLTIQGTYFEAIEELRASGVLAYHSPSWAKAISVVS